MAPFSPYRLDPRDPPDLVCLACHGRHRPSEACNQGAWAAGLILGMVIATGFWVWVLG